MENYLSSYCIIVVRIMCGGNFVPSANTTKMRATSQYIMCGGNFVPSANTTKMRATSQYIMCGGNFVPSANTTKMRATSQYIMFSLLQSLPHQFGSII